MDDATKIRPPEQACSRVGASEVLAAAVARIASGPRHAKSLSRADASAATLAVLDGEDELRAAIYLIALRMKRESDEEFLGVLDAHRARASCVTASVPEVVDLADPYDGFARSNPPSPWLAPVLAACGLPAVVHGLSDVGPKHGLTAHQLFDAVGVPTDLSVSAVAEAVSDPAVGWGYVDQSAFVPGLHALGPLRDRMVKRTVLNTVERVLGPVRGARRTHLVIGYVHAPYVETYSLLAQASGFDSVLLVNGVEGGIIPALTKPVSTHWRDFPGAAAYSDRVVPPPGDASPGRASRFDSSGGTARAASDEALAALQGEPGPFANALVHGAALCLWRLGHAPSREKGAAAARAALASGDAYRRLIALNRNHHSLSIE